MWRYTFRWWWMEGIYGGFCSLPPPFCLHRASTKLASVTPKSSLQPAPTPPRSTTAPGPSSQTLTLATSKQTASTVPGALKLLYWKKFSYICLLKRWRDGERHGEGLWGEVHRGMILEDLKKVPLKGFLQNVPLKDFWKMSISRNRQFLKAFHSSRLIKSCSQKTRAQKRNCFSRPFFGVTLHSWWHDRLCADIGWE